MAIYVIRLCTTATLRLWSLQMTRDSVQHSIDSARRNGEEIEARVATWLKNVDETIEEATKVLKVEERGHMWCSIGTCLKLVPRHQLSEKAKKIVQDIEVLEKDKFEKVSYRPGVGKTTLVTEVERQAKEEKLFDEVALANVTHSPDLRQIQGEIVDALGLKFDEESVSRRARRLRKRLTKTEDKKMILVILDDIWKNLDLQAIRIPYKGCKVLLTSRNRDALISEMGTQKDFGLQVLGEEEVWNLFEKMAGDCVNKDPNLQGVGTEVAKECAGLPLTLVTVFKALKNKKIFEWKDALQLLKRPAPKHLTKMQSTVYCSIELSYKHLENKEVQDVFLLCVEQGYYIHEMDLLKYCYGLGLFLGINTMEAKRNILYTRLRILKDCCLLLHSPNSFESLCMHDVIRDVATLIASRDHNMFVVRANGGLKEWRDEDALRRCVAFSVHGGDIRELSKEMECLEDSCMCMVEIVLCNSQKLSLKGWESSKF